MRSAISVGAFVVVSVALAGLGGCSDDGGGPVNGHDASVDTGVVDSGAQDGATPDAGACQAQTFMVTNSDSTAYTFASLGNNPDLTLCRGVTYTFALDASGHPFYIKTVQGNTTANAYDDGVTGNGTDVGTVTFTVPATAPDTLFYNCQFHSPMTGTIHIVDGI